MTNETTASQPKITPQEKMPKESIGDDAQFNMLADAICWNYVENYVNGGSAEKAQQAQNARRNFIEYVDSCTPSAQASATIQAAPTNTQAKAWMIWLHGPCGIFENKDDAQLEMDRRNKLYPDKNRKILELCALMEADPADVVAQLEGWRGLSKRLIAIIEEMELAATVKAVPSEALEVIESAATIQEPVMVAADSVELIGIDKQLREGAGFWHSCSGCHDTEDGHPTGPYAYSNAMQCALGSGCAECGGLGACWDNNDYSTEDAAPMVADPAGVALSDEQAYAQSGYKHFMTLDKFKEFRADCAAATVKAVPSEALEGAPAELLWVEVNLAAVTANKAFGQWMPERWLQEFVKAYNFEVRATKGHHAAPLADKTGGGE